MLKVRKISTYFYDFLILGFLVFMKKKLNEVLKKKSFFILTCKKKTIFFHEKINLNSEIILFSQDTGIFFSCFKKNLGFFKKILNRNNFYMIYRMGSGIFSNLVFSILCKFWIKKKINKVVLNNEIGSLFFFSREEKRQLFASLFGKGAFFNLKIDGSEQKMIWANNKTRFIVKIFSKKFSRNVVFNFLRQSKSFFIKGDYFFPEYHFSILKMKNFNSLNIKNQQKVIIFSNQIFRNALMVKKQFKQIFKFKSFFLFSRFSPNQILDVSFTQLTKIRRLINACIKLKCSKAIISFSWGRCLIFCKLLVKANKKIYTENKTLEIIRIKDQLYLKLDFKSHHEYFSCRNIEKKTLKRKVSAFFFDVCSKKSNITSFFEFLENIKIITFKIFFLVNSERRSFLKLVKSHFL